MGVTIPNMGTGAGRRRSKTKTGSTLAEALFPATRHRVLGLLFGQPNRRFSLKELIDLARSGSGAVQREVDRLGGSGIVTLASIDGRRFIQANPATPVFEELRAIIAKTTGIPGLLRSALESEGEHVRFALLYGSIAKGTDTSSSDVDVLIVSDKLTQEAAYTLFHDVETRLGRKVNPTIYTREEFKKRRRGRNPFLEKVLAGTHVVLVGNEDVVEPREDRPAQG